MARLTLIIRVRRCPYTQGELAELLGLVAERMTVHTPKERESWYQQAEQRTEKIKENVALRNLLEAYKYRGRLTVPIRELIKYKRAG